MIIVSQKTIAEEMQKILDAYDEDSMQTGNASYDVVAKLRWLQEQ
jgi:hypothetical protein